MLWGIVVKNGDWKGCSGAVEVNWICEMSLCECVRGVRCLCVGGLEMGLCVFFVLFSLYGSQLCVGSCRWVRGGLGNVERWCCSVRVGGRWVLLYCGWVTTVKRGLEGVIWCCGK